MEVIILAGGLGTRLRSVIGDEIPKCMAPVSGKPFLWYLLKYLTRFDISKVVFSVGYLHDVIIDWITANGSEFPFVYDYAVEVSPLGTGGGIREALNKCANDNVVVLNGDTYFDVDLQELLEKHDKLETSHVTLALKPLKSFERYGRVIVDKMSHVVIRFQEKKYCEEGLINGGIYVIDRRNVAWPDLDKFSFETEVLELGTKIQKIYGFDYNSYFIDIGVPTDYIKANNTFKNIFKIVNSNG